MLGNNEKIQGINPGEVFAKMLGELPWASLKTYVQANAPLLKLCTSGGYRLEPQRRERVEKLILREAEKNSFSEAICNGVFASWYPVHQHLHKNLEDYFHSEQYKEWRTAQGLSEDDYVLTDEKFNEFFQIADLQAWKILLRFSPLKFTSEQAEKILDQQQGNSELLEKIVALEAEMDELRRKSVQGDSELERLRSKAKADTSEIQELKKSARQQKAEIESLQQKFEGSQAEVKRLNQRLQDSDQSLQARETVLREELNRDILRYQNDNTRLSKDLATWQSKYEEQRLQNRGYMSDAAAAEKLRLQAERERDTALEEVTTCRNFADLLLSRIDWPKVGAAMKMSPTIRRNFNSLVKRLNYEEDRTLSIEGTLPEFWGKLCSDERELIKKISRSNTLEVQNGDVEAFWSELGESFADVRINLEARLFMLGMLHDIFFQVFSEDTLAAPVLPPAKARKN